MRSADGQPQAAPLADAGREGRPLRVLIANHQLWRYTGSEIHALQLAEYFRDQGAEVMLFAVSAEPWLVADIEARGIEVLNRRALRKALRWGFDIVWTHHETPFYLLHILYGVRCRLAVHGILSRVAKLERLPLLPPVARPDRLVILANSVETRDDVAERSGQDGIGVLLNIVPEAFGRHPKVDYAPKLRRVVVVSNHIPDEVIDAKRLLAERAVEVELIGEGHRKVLVDHSTLADFDVVVTIGKTAQYAIVQGIPLFLYDVFGGPGYVSPEGFEHHEAFNFSGRSEPHRMSAQELADALVDGYAAGIAAAQALRESHGERYGVGPQTAEVMARMEVEALSLYEFRARLRGLVATLLARPTVPARLAVPKTVDAVGNWLKTLRK